MVLYAAMTDSRSLMGRGRNNESGKTYTGMVKSYNRKGFGFIMCPLLDQDIYFSRESICPQLQTSDLAGEHVTFEVHRFSDGKLQARSLRAVGDVSGFKGPREPPRPQGKGAGLPGKGTPFYGGKEEEDRSRDWMCENKACGERNFVKRFECHKCKAPRPAGSGIPEQPAVMQPPPRRTLSPHAGSRAMADICRARLAAKGRGGGSRSRSRRRSRSKRRKKRSSSGTSSERKKRKRKDRSKKRHKGSRSGSERPKAKEPRGSSSSSASSSDGAGGKSASAAGGGSKKDKDDAPTNPEAEKAKGEVLERLLKLREVEPKEERIKRWRALLREWHPDKNLDRAEVATAVFQFLQKGKSLMDNQ